MSESSIPSPPAQAGRSPAWARHDYLVVAVIAIAALGLRLNDLGDPPGIMFDETYYAKDACWYVEVSARVCGGITEEQTQIHPPLGKWLIAAGIAAFGYEPFGWRLAPAIAGAATVAVLYVLARRLLRSTAAAALVALLFAIDLLHLVQSRIAMLDVFVPLFGLAAVLCVVLDRDRLAAGGTKSLPLGRAGGLLDRPWRLFAGVFLGAAVASKWSGAYFVLVALALTVAWEVGARRADGRRRPLRRALHEEHRSIVVWLMAVPVLVYSLSYVGRIDGDVAAVPWNEGSWVRRLWERQDHMLDFHANQLDDAVHPYQSPAWSWPLLRRPVSYFYCSGDECEPSEPDGVVAEVLATGSPFAWWSSLAALVVVAGSWLRRRDQTAPHGVILTGFTLNWAPWLLPQVARPTVFLFYMLPSVPFMYLAVGWVATRLGRSWEARAAHALFVAGAVAAFAFYYPLAAKIPITRSQWDRRISDLFDDCDRETGVRSPPAVTETVAGTVTTRTAETGDDGDPPPEGWCWI